MRLQYGISSFERSRGDLAELPVINMYAEAAATEETGLVLQSRPGLVDRGADMGTGPVKALFKADGVLSGALFGISGVNLYQATTSLGPISGAGPFGICGFEDRIFISTGGPLHTYDGTTLSLISFPDGADVTHATVGASRLLAIRADTEQFYWSDVLSSTVDGLSFSSAESQPDRLRHVLFIDDIAILFGAETVEFHANTGDSDLPFAPIEGRVMERGIKNTGAATKIGTTFAWVTDANQVCLADQDNVISTPGLEALIGESSQAFLFPFFIDGTELMALRIDAGTWVFNPRAGTFSEFTSFGQTNWLAQCHAGGVFGSAVDGKTYAWGEHVDAGGTLERLFRAGAPINGGGFMVNDVSLRCNTGQTPYLSGDYADPAIEMRLSRNAGRTWGEWRSTTLGTQGQYRKAVKWHGCGMAARPGLLTEFRMTAPVDFRVSDVLVNESTGAL